MDRIEVFSNRVHGIALKAEEFEPRIPEIIEPNIKSFAMVAAYCLEEMDKFLLMENETDDDVLKYINDTAKLAQLGMLGYKYEIGGETTFTRIANQMVDTYKRKNADYGDSFGASLDKYGPVAAHVRMSDKINRLQSLVVRKQTAQVKDESIADTFLDLACYAIMRLVYVEMKSAELDEEKEATDE